MEGGRCRAEDLLSAGGASLSGRSGFRAQDSRPKGSLRPAHFQVDHVAFTKTASPIPRSGLTRGGFPAGPAHSLP